MVGAFKARCAYSTSFNPQSAIRELCAPAKAGCSTHGIVTAGFSQGGVLAALARNYDTRVRGTWAMGFADVDIFGTNQRCFDQGSGALGTNHECSPRTHVSRVELLQVLWPHDHRRRLDQARGARRTQRTRRAL